MSANDDEEAHWNLVMRSYLQYQEFSETRVNRRKRSLEKLHPRYKKRVPESSSDLLDHITVAVADNAFVLNDIVEWQDTQFRPRDLTGNPPPDPHVGPDIPSRMMERCDSVIHSMYREWSHEGAAERAQSFAPLLHELQRLLPVTTPTEAYRYRVAVPGCGLGRLPVEICALGYTTQANEYSVYMLLATNYMLNCPLEPLGLCIRPWLHVSSNVVSNADVLESCAIPDQSSSDILEDGPWAHLPEDEDEKEGKGAREGRMFLPRFSFAAGDFCSIYGGAEMQGQWDAVVTCFFIDTAPNVLEYIDVIHSMLRPGGVWINVGPLLYHWASDVEGTGDERFEGSLELSYDDLKEAILSYGFEYKSESRIRAQYAAHPRSMSESAFNCVFFSVVKSQLGTTDDSTTATVNTTAGPSSSQVQPAKVPRLAPSGSE